MPDICNETDQSFDTLLSAQRPSLLRLCRRLTGSADSAEDLVQEVLLEAWRCQHQLRDQQRLPQWLAGIARNVCHHWLRKHAAQTLSLTHVNTCDDGLSESTAADAIMDDVDLEIELERKELIELLDHALSLLPRDICTILIERYVHESSLAEIAALLETSPGSAAMRLHRGKIAFRRVLSTHFPQEIVHYVQQPLEKLTWGETNIWCTRCGRRHLRVRLPGSPRYLNFLCPACDIPDGTTGSIHCPLSRSIKGYKRALQHSVKTFQPESASETLPCPNCWQPLHFTTSFAEALPAWCQHWRGAERSEQDYLLYACCTSCQLWMMLYAHSFLPGHPTIYRFWQQQQRIITLPAQEIEFAGRPAHLIRFESLTSAARIAAILARDRYEVLGVFHEEHR